MAGMIPEAATQTDNASRTQGAQKSPATRPARSDFAPPRIDLFGAWPDRAEVPFMSRPGGALTQHSFTAVGGDFDPDVSPEGQSLVFASTRHRSRPALYVKSVAGRAVIQLTRDRGSDVQPAFSPDGDQVAFASDRSGSWDLWLVNVEGGRPVRLTDDEGYELHPTWSPSGNELAYCRITPRAGAWELWVLDLDRPAARRFIGHGLFPRWSPIDNRLVYQQARERAARLFSIWTVELVDGEPRRATEIVTDPHRALISPTWSPDGSQLAYTSIEAGTAMPAGYDAPRDRPSEIWIVDADGRNAVRLTDRLETCHSPTWSPDGRIFFTSTRSGHENIWSLRPVGSGLLSRRTAVNPSRDEPMHAPRQPGF